MPTTCALLSAVTMLHAAVQPIQIPYRAGVTIVQAIAGDTLRGDEHGDYERFTQVASVSDDQIELSASAYVRAKAGGREWLSSLRRVTASDLRTARTQILGFNTSDALSIPGTTALGPSIAVISEAERYDTVEVRVRTWANAWDNPGVLRRVGGTEPFPILINGRRTALSAIHMRGQLGPTGHLRPWEFWFLDDTLQPLTLKLSYGAEGAVESSRPEYSRQIVRIDIPDTDDGGTGIAPGAGSVTGVEGGGDGDAGRSTGGGQGGAAPGAGGGFSIGAVGAGLDHALASSCRVQMPGIYFAFASDELNPASAPWIRSIAELLRRHPAWTVTIEGHTDSIGGATYNRALSDRRAAALKRALVVRHEIAGARLTTRGIGATRPLESNATLEGRARNRRVELARPCAPHAR